MPIGSISSGSLQSVGIGMDDFLRILMTQLSYQDPLKPMDNQEFMAQMAQFTALEQTRQLNEKTQQLITNEAALQSVGLIGTEVDINTTDGQFRGTVTALSLSGETPVLNVYNSTTGRTIPDVSLSQIFAVRRAGSQ